MVEWDFQSAPPSAESMRSDRSLGLDAELVRTHLGTEAVEWAIQLGEDVIAEAARERLNLPGSAAVVEAIRGATAAATLRILAIIGGCAPPETSPVPDEVVEGARDLARQGMKLSEFTAMVRHSHSTLFTSFFDAVSAGRGGPDELRRVSRQLFTLIDEFVGVTTEVFLEEQRNWHASNAAAQLELVHQIIDGVPYDRAEAQRILNYPLDSHHVAVIAWRRPGSASSPRSLRAAIEPVLRYWGNPHALLLIPIGTNTLWAWGAFSSSRPRQPSSTISAIAGVSIALGQMGEGIGAFRRSHAEALAVERLIRERPTRSEAVVAHEDLDLTALLLADPEGARHFVIRQLGPLARDERRMQELRRTLRLYFDLDRSLAKVAALENISRNAVTYRVQQALKLCGHDPESPTLRIRAALSMVDWLADA